MLFNPKTVHPSGWTVYIFGSTRKCMDWGFLRTGVYDMHHK